MIRYHARWVLPIAEPPIQDGWITIDRGRVVAVGRPGPRGDAQERDLGEVAVLPGLVNAHTHLELSYLRDQIAPAPSFVAWIRAIMDARGQRADPHSPEIMTAVDEAIEESVRCGTAVVGDISNTLVTVEPLSKSPLAGVVFNELIRFNAPDPAGLVERARRRLEMTPRSESVRTSLAAHSPYSVAPLVLRAIRQAMDRDPLAPCSVHLSESCEELEFIATGGGAWRTLLQDIGAWDPAWVPPGVSPVQYLDEAGFLHERVLAVHGVQMSEGDLARLVARRVTLVTCPRSNGHTGAGAPPLRQFYESGVAVAIGTDSLASAPDLNVFAEMATMRALAPGVPARALIESATWHGARALAFDADYGTIEPGKRARLLAVDVPPETSDVEEYLLSGILPPQLRWLDV